MTWATVNDAATWLNGQTFSAANIGGFNGLLPTVNTDGSLTLDGSTYTGSIAYLFQGASGAGQLVSESFYAVDPATARLEYKLTYADGHSLTTFSTQVIGFNATQILTEGYGYTSNGAYPGGFASASQSPAYYAVFSLTPLTAQDQAYAAGSTVPSFTFATPEPSAIALLAVAIIAVVAARALRFMRSAPATA